MSVKSGDNVYFVKRKYEDVFFKHNETQGYSCVMKEMILKGVVTNVKDDNITIKLAENKKSEVKEKEDKIKVSDLLTKITIPAKSLGIWN
jgi:hypothetical protein